MQYRAATLRIIRVTAFAKASARQEMLARHAAKGEGLATASSSDGEQRAKRQGQSAKAVSTEQGAGSADALVIG
jgi:hypothetical protein